MGAVTVGRRLCLLGQRAHHREGFYGKHMNNGTELGEYVSVPPPANFVFAWALDGLVRLVLIGDYAYSASIADFVSAEPF